MTRKGLAMANIGKRWVDELLKGVLEEPDEESIVQDEWQRLLPELHEKVREAKRRKDVSFDAIRFVGVKHVAGANGWESVERLYEKQGKHYHDPLEKGDLRGLAERVRDWCESEGMHCFLRAEQIEQLGNLHPHLFVLAVRPKVE